QSGGLGQEEVIDRHHDLLRLKPELHGGLFDGIDTGPIYIRLAGLAQTAVTHGNAKAFEETLEGRRAAVHSRSLHHLGRQQAARPQSHSRHGVPPRLFPASTARADTPRRWPATRRTRATGVSRSTSTSTVPGRPCWSGTCEAAPSVRWSSTRIWPSRTSWATLVTVAARLPYWVQGKPARRRRAGWPGWRR